MTFQSVIVIYIFVGASLSMVKIVVEKKKTVYKVTKWEKIIIISPAVECGFLFVQGLITQMLNTTNTRQMFTIFGFKNYGPDEFALLRCLFFFSRLKKHKVQST